MNLAALTRGALARLPAEAQGDVVFTRTTPGTYDPATDTTTGAATQTCTARAFGTPASGTPADGFQARTTLRESTRVLVVPVPAAGLAFVPASGQSASWDGTLWTVRAVSGVPNATAPAAFRVTIEK